MGVGFAWGSQNYNAGRGDTNPFGGGGGGGFPGFPPAGFSSSFGAAPPPAPAPARQTTGPGGQAGWDWTPAPAPGAPAPGPPAGGGAAAGGGGGSVPGLTPPPNLSNVATDNPDLRFLIDQYKNRLSAAPEQRAIEQAGSAIRDVSSGLQKELGGNLASRGMLGSGVENEMRNRLAMGAQQQVGKAAGAISTQRQQDLDKLVMGGEGLMKAPAQNALSQQELGLQQYGLQQQGEIARMQAEVEQQRLAMQQQQQAANLWGTYMNSFF